MNNNTADKDIELTVDALESVSGGTSTSYGYGTGCNPANGTHNLFELARIAAGQSGDVMLVAQFSNCGKKIPMIANFRDKGGCHLYDIPLIEFVEASPAQVST